MHSPPGRCLAPALQAGALAAAMLLVGCGNEPALHVDGGDPARGRAAIERYGCVACHTIPGIPSFGANVGPPLVNMARQGYVAGVLPNTPEELIRWLRSPPEVDPRTAMPDLGVSAAEARDMAAYLYSR